MKNKTKYLSSTFYFLSIIACFSQAKKNEGIATYTQIINNEKHNAKLYFSPNKSYYIFNLLGQDPKNTSDTGEMRLDDKPDESGEIYFIDYATKQVSAREKVGTAAFLYGEPLPNINWKLGKDTKKIGKFICQKATTTFRGRNYEAWFTTAIPISIGPWKLHGLPGLILEAYDDTKDIQFIYNGVSIPESVDKYKTFPKTKGRKITFEEHKTIVSSTYQKAINAALADSPKGTKAEFQIDMRGIIEKSYEK
jgi:GLPGLI family protein